MKGAFDRDHADLFGRIIKIVVVRKEADQVFGPNREQFGFDVIHGFGDLRLIAVLLGMLQHQIVGCADDGWIQHDEWVLVQFGKGNRLLVKTTDGPRLRRLDISRHTMAPS